jgi:hypothetical protein
MFWSNDGTMLCYSGKCATPTCLPLYRIYSRLVSETHVDVMEKLAQRSIGTNVPISTEVNA